MKKIFSIIGLITLFMPFNIFAEDISLFRGAPCPCGGQYHDYGTDYSPRYLIENVKCRHGYAYGNDVVYGKNVYNYWLCNKCGNMKTFESTIITDTVCHGYNA